MKRLVLSGLVLLLAAGCAKKNQDVREPEDTAAAESGGRLEATAAERQVLALLDGMPSASPQDIGADSVVAEPQYFAASGQPCRRVVWATGARLACRDEAGWYFVPDVFASAPEAQ